MEIYGESAGESTTITISHLMGPPKTVISDFSNFFKKKLKEFEPYFSGTPILNLERKMGKKESRKAFSNPL
jgi:hypothetical protein